MRITAFYRTVLGAAVANERWSWGAVDPVLNRVYLRVWEDQLVVGPDGEEVQVHWEHRTTRSPGMAERLRHLELVRGGAQALGVLCVADDPSNRNKRKIVDFDAEELLVLGKIRRDAASGLHWARIDGRLAVSELPRLGPATAAELADLEGLRQRRDITATERQALATARVGQGQFRRDVLAMWDGRCAVTGVALEEVIRASHIKPWRKCSDEERLDRHNGLPLAAHLDALFDAGLIGFDELGRMLVSDVDAVRELSALGLEGVVGLREQPSRTCAAFLKWHRDHVLCRRKRSARARVRLA